MLRRIPYAILGLLLGLAIGYCIVFYTPTFSPKYNNVPAFESMNGQKQVIGFLTYWLLNKAQTDYSSYITTLSYFAVRIDADGSIQKLTSPQEAEPGWFALKSGKLDPFFENARNHNIALSLVIDSGNSNTIEQLVSSPSAHAQALAQDLTPLINKYGFSDINLDIEYTATATDTLRAHFTEFVNDVKRNLPQATLTVEVSPTDAIRKNLIDVKAIGEIANYIVLMTYDYHAPDSYVTGPIAPLYGAGVSSEYDVTTAIQKVYALVPSQKIIVGIPLYGYEWETLGALPRSAVIPGTGVLASTKRTEELLTSCATCSAHLDEDAHEKYISYFNSETNTNHMIFFPDGDSTKDKINFTNALHLGGLALWALGYEGQSALFPLKSYK